MKHSFAIVFEYSNFIEYAGIVISLTTMIILVAFVVLREKLRMPYLVRIFRKLERWWLKEE